MHEADWSGFTEQSFRALIQALKDGGYRFIRFGDVAGGRQVLWRHDVDFSVHRAVALARIEQEAGVVATYFLNPRSSGYNLAESAVLRRARQIGEAGHELGLHFDAEVYGYEDWNQERLHAAVQRERSLLELLLERPVRVVSWHNPTLSNLMEFGEDEVCGMVNAYARNFREGFVYASDSNGYWRYKPMLDVIAEGHERLQLLTHPEWWPPEPLSPALRMERCLRGRANAALSTYEDLLIRDGRPSSLLKR